MKCKPPSDGYLTFKQTGRPRLSNPVALACDCSAQCFPLSFASLVPLISIPIFSPKSSLNSLFHSFLTDLPSSTVAIKHHSEVKYAIREAFALSASPHLCIVSLYITFIPRPQSNPQENALVLEYLPSDLREVLKHRPREFTFEKHLIVILGIFHSIAFIHQNGLIHRDVNPANILLDDDFHPKLADF
jgi:serine/threonine protein kinase